MVYVDALPQPTEQTLFPQRVHTTVGSSGAGKALNCGRLQPTTFFGMVGDDAEGAQIVDFFGEQPVRFLRQIDPTGSKRHFNLMAADGQRLSIFLHGGMQAPLSDWAFLQAELVAADYISIVAYPYTRSLLPLLSDIAAPLWLDVQTYDGQDPYWDDFIAAADVIQLSTARMPAYRDWMKRMIDAGKEAVVCTHGVRGATVLSTQEGWVETAATLSDNVVDTNGAGDGFFAGVLFGRSTGCDWETSMRYGAQVAKRVVESAELYNPHLSAAGLETSLRTSLDP